MPRPEPGCDFLLVWFIWADSLGPICQDLRFGEIVDGGPLDGKVVRSSGELIGLLKAQLDEGEYVLVRLAAFDQDGNELYSTG